MTLDRARTFYGILACVLALLWFVMFFLGTGHADLTILGLLYAGDRPALADAARVITLLGGWYFVTPLVVLVALVVAIRRKPWLGLVLLVGTFVGRMLVELQKYELGRMRPDQHPHLVNTYNLSFPSGHSANAMMVFVGLALTLVEDGRQRRFWLLGATGLAVLVGLSRLMLGVHWPSDVIAGWSFGLLWAMLLAWLAHNPPEWAVKR